MAWNSTKTEGRPHVATIVQLDNRRAGPVEPLDALIALVEDDLKAVNQTIVDRMHSPVALIPQLAGHIVAAGGKRLRPLLTLAAAKLCGYTEKRHIKLATCVEFIHTATLLHDDVVDDSELRRGQSSANALWGNQPSVLVGDFLFSRAFELMVEDGSLKVLGILSRASSIIAEGEVHQLMTTNDTETSEAQYLEVVQAKTAELFAAASRIGAVVADRPNVEEEALQVYGLNLGIAFQLIDDVLDYSAKQAELGKTIGDDFREGKITMPVILAFRRGDDEERAFWHRCLHDLEQGDEELAHALSLMEKHGSLTDSIHRAQHYGDVARDALGIFPDSPVKTVLIDIIDFCIKRAY
ncbi:MAG: polyprenyl synthetase family protein [Rhodospirillaceae bacterium]|nr:polyprenyl synthetase family protein [Rhodospirillaceae bacterium]